MRHLACISLSSTSAPCPRPCVGHPQRSSVRRHLRRKYNGSSLVSNVSPSFHLILFDLRPVPSSVRGAPGAQLRPSTPPTQAQWKLPSFRCITFIAYHSLRPPPCALARAWGARSAPPVPRHHPTLLLWPSGKGRGGLKGGRSHQVCRPFSQSTMTLRSSVSQWSLVPSTAVSARTCGGCAAAPLGRA